MASPRRIALKWLSLVVEGRSVNEILSHQNEALSAQESAQAKQLLFGSLRYYHQLKTLTDSLLDKPLKAKDLDIQLAIILGLYQLKYLSTPDHAAISESVELVKSLKKNWAAGLVNGVLRRYQRESMSLEASLAKSVQFQFSHPGWIVKQLRQDWPEEADQILSQNNQKAPMILRVNTRKISRDDYINQLSSNGVDAIPHPLAPDGVILQSAMDVFGLPGFGQGEVTVQDAAPQLAVELLNLVDGQKILDACAAPGGKTGHILQRVNSADVTALELSESRAARIRETLNRMDLSCNIQCADFLELDAWWDGQKFDRILLDVPCSASGVIRRNPDIKLHRRVTDLKKLTEIQADMLKVGWQLLNKGGILVYATCSVFKAENEQQIEAFTEHLRSNNAEFRLLSMPAMISAEIKPRAQFGYQILPGDFEMDGFYLCALEKR